MNETEKRRRLLVISYHYPPDGAVGGLRWAGFSKYLGRMGWDVHIVTLSPAGVDPDPEHVYRHTRARISTINDAYNGVARRVRQSAPTPALTGVALPVESESLAHRVIAALRRVGQVAVGFPDIGRGWVMRAAMAGRELLNQEHFDAVISSGPPHSAHLAGWIATLGRDEPLFVDMRDPWLQAQGGWTSSWVGRPWVQWLFSMLQTTVFAKASGVIANTREFAAQLRTVEPTPAVSYVPNGIDLELLPKRTADRLEGFSIAYVGTLYLDRSFSTVLDGLRSLMRERPELAKVTLHIAGHIDGPNLEGLRAQLAAHGLTDVVRFYGRIPRADALTLLARANLALVLAQNQWRSVPAKIYECVGLGVPTLVVTETGSATSNEAARIGAMSVEGDDCVGMRRILDDMVDGRLPSTMAPKAPISYESLAIRMDEILSGVARRTR